MVLGAGRWGMLRVGAGRILEGVAGVPTGLLKHGGQGKACWSPSRGYQSLSPPHLPYSWL